MPFRTSSLRVLSYTFLRMYDIAIFLRGGQSPFTRIGVFPILTIRKLSHSIILILLLSQALFHRYSGKR